MPPIKWTFIFTFCHSINNFKNEEVLNYNYFVTLVIIFIVSILQYEIFYPPASF